MINWTKIRQMTRRGFAFSGVTCAAGGAGIYFVPVIPWWTLIPLFFVVFFFSALSVPPLKPLGPSKEQLALKEAELDKKLQSSRKALWTPETKKT